MATFLGMQTDIMDELADQGTITTDQVKKAIWRSIEFYQRRDWWFLQKTATFNTVIGQEYYGAAALADIPNIRNIVTLKRTANDLTLLGVDNDEIEAAQDGNSTGTPCQFAYWESQIRLHPVPVVVEQLKITYFRRLPALSADSDSNAFTTEAEELIRQAAKRRIALDVLHDEGLATRCTASEKLAYDELLSENAQRTAKKIRTSDIPPLRHSFNIETGL